MAFVAGVWVFDSDVKMNRALEIKGLIARRPRPSDLDALWNELNAYVDGVIPTYVREFAIARGVSVYRACFTSGIYEYVDSRAGFCVEPRLVAYIEKVQDDRRRVECMMIKIVPDLGPRLFELLV